MKKVGLLITKSMVIRLSILFIVFYVTDMGLIAQDYTSRYNSTLRRYEYFNSSGRLIGYEKWNPTLKRWEYTERNRSNESQGYTSPYNIDLMYKGMAEMQARVDRNIDEVSKKVHGIYDVLENVRDVIGGFDELQKAEIDKFYNEIKNTKVDYSNNGKVRNVLSRIEEWSRYFKSWRSEGNDRYKTKTSNINNKISTTKSTNKTSNRFTKNIEDKIYSGKVKVIKGAPIMDKPELGEKRGKEITKAYGTVQILQYIKESSFYKVSYNGETGYIWHGWIKKE